MQRRRVRPAPSSATAPCSSCVSTPSSLAASQVFRPLLFAFSRSREWAADRFALAATNDPQAGAAAFRRLREQNLADEDPPRWYELFFSSHPSLRARIAALEKP